MRREKSEKRIVKRTKRNDNLLVENCRFFLARLEGLEPPTYRLEGGCSIQLSYKRIHIKKPISMGLFTVERVMGIEPTSPAWKAGILAVEQHPHLLRQEE